MKILNPGIYTEISPENYHSDPCATPSLSASIAAILVKESPAHAYAYHPHLGGYSRRTTASMFGGSLLHALLLGEEHKIVRIEADSFRTKVAKEARDSVLAEGKLPVLEDEFNEQKQKAERLRAKLKERGYDLDDGDHEITLVWYETADDGTKVLCRGRVDHLSSDSLLMLDLKKCANGHPRKCSRSFTEFSYEIQWAAYSSALRTVAPQTAGRGRFEYLFLEDSPVLAITPFEPDGSLRKLGEIRWRRAVNLWARCLRENHWPEYVGVGEVCRGSASVWELRDEGLEEELEKES